MPQVPAPELGAPDRWVADAAVRLRPGVRPPLEVRALSARLWAGARQWLAVWLHCGVQQGGLAKRQSRRIFLSERRAAHGAPCRDG